MVNAKSIKEKIRFLFYTSIHPFKGFWDCKYEGEGSLAVANGLVVSLILSSIIKRQYTEYVFNYARPEELNVPMEIAAVLIPLLLWCVSGWLVSTLLDGKGTFRDIYIYSSYALMPVVLGNIVSTLYSQVSTLDDASLYNFIGTLTVLWAAGLMLLGTMTVHQYSMRRTLLSILAVALGMALIIFVVLVFFSVIQQIYGFIYVFSREILLRM